MSTEVYTGTWVNWSQGAIKGATLTLDDRSGGLLTAFLALFVTIVASQLWRVSCFVVHQLRATHSGHDHDFYERQVILRNAATPATGAWAFMVHGLQGRKRDGASLVKSLPWIVVSILFLVVFAVAAVFSSNISKSAGDERLVKSTVCGRWPPNVGADDWIAKINNDTFSAANYARACYGGTANNRQCLRMPVSEIKYTSNRNASCPFATGLCVYGDTAAINMTTKLIDSQADLGINTPAEHRAQIQFTKSCAPLNATNYRVGYNATEDERYGMAGDRLIQYQFGPIDGGVGRDKNLTTYVVNTRSALGHGGYVLVSYSSVASTSGDVLWTPIQALNRTDADVSIIFLEANTILFNGSNNDPLFGAHDESSNTPGLYFSDDWATAVACAEQLRVCNPLNKACTPYFGSEQMFNYFINGTDYLGFNPTQLMTASRLIGGTVTLSLGDQIGIRAAGALRVIETTFAGRIQPPIPDNQWMIEVGSWFDTAMAKFQLRVMEFAAGPTNPAYRDYYQRPAVGTILLAYCNNQIVHDESTTTSFSILGLVILFTVGGIVIVLNQTAEPVVGMIQKRSGRGYGKQKRWVADDVMSLQQFARNAQRSSSVDTFSLLDYKSGLTRRKDPSRSSVAYSPAPSQDYITFERADIPPPSRGHRQNYLDDYGVPLTHAENSHI